jgi:hypothetical protein
MMWTPGNATAHLIDRWGVSRATLTAASIRAVEDKNKEARLE